MTAQYIVGVFEDLPQAVKNGIEHFPVIMQEPQAAGKIATPEQCERWLC